MTTQRREKGISIEKTEAISGTVRPMLPTELAFLRDIPKASIHLLCSN
ncbi:MAG: hypothetical protein ACI9ES_001245 [Oceanospirillaceae bacterium]|jgi:hypothetical protein